MLSLLLVVVHGYMVLHSRYSNPGSGFFYGFECGIGSSSLCRLVCLSESIDYFPVLCPHYNLNTFRLYFVNKVSQHVISGFVFIPGLANDLFAVGCGNRLFLVAAGYQCCQCHESEPGCDMQLDVFSHFIVLFAKYNLVRYILRLICYAVAYFLEKTVILSSRYSGRIPDKDYCPSRA